MKAINIASLKSEDHYDLSLMVGELLEEIMIKVDRKVFNFNQAETEERIPYLINEGKYWVFIAKEKETNKNIGFVSLYESYALYSQGAYGTMPELYVRPDWRSKEIGQSLLDKVAEFARKKGWHRIEVTTPPLPEFDRTLHFYQNNGFEIAGGRKLKIEVTD